jgi:hypothetical protein
MVQVRREIYMIDPDLGRFLLEDQNHETNNRRWVALGVRERKVGMDEAS